jgi:hypothetical protein
MAPFDPDADTDTEAADWRLALNGFVTLFWNPAVLGETTGWLVDHGYHVVTADAAAWTTDADLHRDLAALLDFPDYYGANLDALNDCLGDVAGYDYGTPRAATGLVLVLTRYDAFAARSRRTAQLVLDIFAHQARFGALIGHRMLCLVQSDDPDIRFAPIGASPVSWNDEEWLDAKRRP